MSLESDVHLHGIHFIEGMILSSGQCSGLPDFFRILCVLVNANKVAFLCKRLSSWYIEHYRCYTFSETSAIEILVQDDLNDPHRIVYSSGKEHDCAKEIPSQLIVLQIATQCTLKVGHCILI